MLATPMRTLRPEEELALLAIGNARRIAEGTISCRALAPELTTLENLEYLRRRRIYGLGAAGVEGSDSVLKAFELLWTVQKTALQELILAFAGSGIDVLVYKGAEVIEAYGMSFPYTARRDMDVLIRPSDVPTAKRILSDLGYVQANFDTETLALVNIPAARIEAAERGNYALVSFARVQTFDSVGSEAWTSAPSAHPFYVRDGKATIVVAIDLATGLDSSLGAETLFSEAVESAHPGASAIKPEEHLWYLCAMFYLEVLRYADARKLTQLADLSLFLSGYEVDWSRVVVRARELDILPCVYYPLAFLNALSDTLAVPDRILEQLLPTSGSRARDYGWQLHKLFGRVEPVPMDMLPRSRVPST